MAKDLSRMHPLERSFSVPIYPNFYQTLSACPIVELRGYAAACGLKGHLYAYLDFYGPTGTARDGLAEGMLALAIEKKQLSPGQPIIEAASGPFHNGAGGGKGLVKIRVDRHKGTPFSWDTTLLS